MSENKTLRLVMPRKELQTFAKACEVKLLKRDSEYLKRDQEVRNSPRGRGYVEETRHYHWSKAELETLFIKLQHEQIEFSKEFFRYLKSPDKFNIKAMKDEIVDMGNFCMMLYDNISAIEESNNDE